MMEASVKHKRETLEVAKRVIPLMHEDEIVKISMVFMEVFERLAKEGRVREE